MTNVVSIHTAKRFKRQFRNAWVIASLVREGVIQKRQPPARKPGKVLFLTPHRLVHGVAVFNNRTRELYLGFLSEEHARHWVLNHLSPQDNPEIINNTNTGA